MDVQTMAYKQPMIATKEKSSIKANDRQATIVLGVLILTGAILACRIQIAYSPSLWTHALIALPPALIAVFVPIQLLKKWPSRKRERSLNTQAGIRSAQTHQESESHAAPSKPDAEVVQTFEQFVA
jgi:hypothetical protein